MRALLVNQPDDLAHLLRQRGLEVRSIDVGVQALDIALAFTSDAAVLDDDELSLALKVLEAVPLGHARSRKYQGNAARPMIYSSAVSSRLFEVG
jgi:hypothetical protein